MNDRNDVRDFLITRRGKITPEQAGLQAYGANRRVSGLRREEVALLAGVSVDYYIRLERGNLRGVSDSVLDAIARALQLDEAERLHLFDLANARNRQQQARRRPSRQLVRPSVQRLLDMMAAVPAYVRNGSLDVLATNDLGRALYSEVFDGNPAVPLREGAGDGKESVNLARFTFLDPRATTFYDDWDTIANDTVAILRTTAGSNPYDRAVSDLVGELSTRSEEFRTRWAAHNVRLHRTGIKRVHHPVVGDLELTYESLEIPADPGLRMSTYTAEPGSPSADGLQLLASWITPHQALAEEPSDAGDPA